MMRRGDPFLAPPPPPSPLPPPPILSEIVLSTSGIFSKICLPEPFKFLATDVLRILLPINQ